MSDMDPLYQLMENSANDMSRAAVEQISMITSDAQTDVVIEGYGPVPSYAKQIKDRIGEMTMIYSSEAEAQNAINAGKIPAGYTIMVGDLTTVGYASYYTNSNGVLTPVLDANSNPVTQPTNALVQQLMSDLLTEVTTRKSLISFFTAPGYLFALADKDKREAFGLRSTDGGPTDHTLSVWVRRINEQSMLPLRKSIPGYSYVFTLDDSNSEERMTELSILENGKFADWVIEAWAARMAPLIDVDAKRPNPDGTWLHPSGDRVAYELDKRTIVGLGSSSTNRSLTYYTQMATSFDAAYVNMGTEGAIISQNAAHIGAVPALISVVGGSIPASGPVAVTASNIPSNGIAMAMGGSLGGVPGAIAWSNGNTGTFTRSTAGSAVAVPNNTPFVPNSSRYRANEIILESGKNDINQGRDASTILDLTSKIVNWLAPFIPTTVVMGHFANGSYSSTSRTRLAQVNSGIVSTYGNRAIDQQAWLTSNQLWTDLANEGITPTSQDLADQAAGDVPQTLMTAARDHLTTDGYRYRMKYLVKPKLIELGLYKETL